MITVPYRRRREGKTNYHQRLRLLLSQNVRVLVRITNTRVIAQVVQFDRKGDRILAATDSYALRKLGWTYSCKNIPAAYLTGMLLAHKAAATGVTQGILDVGLRTPIRGGRLYAFLRGAVEGGLQISADEKVFPVDERVKGNHVREYLSKASVGKGQFAQYLKSTSRTDIVTQAESLKQKINVG